MARMPGATWVGPHHDNGLMTRWDVVVVHTIVGYAPAHAAHFSVKADGTILQSRDTRYQSAANLYGNPRVIAIENEDHGPAFGSWGGSDVPALTPPQVEANAKIAAWVHKTHGTPLVACPDSKPESKGVGYHRQGCDGNFIAAGYKYPGRVAGGELWTRHYGKVCPGDRRISQVPQIINRARQIAGLEDDMSLTKKTVNWIANTVAGVLLNRDAVDVPWDDPKNPRWKVKFAWAHMWAKSRDAAILGEENKKAIAELQQQNKNAIASLAGQVAGIGQAVRQHAEGEHSLEEIEAAALRGAAAAIEAAESDPKA